MKPIPPSRPTARTSRNSQKMKSGRWAKERKALNLRGRAAFKHWPTPNRFFFACACGSLGVGTLSLIGPPLAFQAEAAFFPYTAEGKRQTCLSNLAILARALELYAQDNNGYRPGVGNVSPASGAASGASGTPRTWVTRLSSYASTAGGSPSVWVCSTGQTVAGSEASAYGLNLVLAGEPVAQDGDSTTLLLSDRGSLDNLMLVPLAPGWELPYASSSELKSATNAGKDPHLATNIAFRHEESANALFADGHAGMLSPQDTKSFLLWGGPAVVEGGVRRLARRDTTSAALVRALRKKDVKGSANLLRGAKSLTRAVGDLHVLWTLNWQQDAHGGPSALASPSLEGMGWTLVRALEGAGRGGMRTVFEVQTERRSDEEHGRIALTPWQQLHAVNGIGMEVPAGWKWEEVDEGRYHTAIARSPLPSLWCSIERGERSSYSGPLPVDWSVSEKKLKAKYGRGYKRLKLEDTTFLGRPAGLWEYEIEKVDSPRLRKRYIGTADGWQSYVFSVTAPSNCFGSWDGDFDRILRSLTLN